MRTSFAMNQSSAVKSVYIPFLVRGIAAFLLVFLIPLEFIVRNVLVSMEDSVINKIQEMETESLNQFFKAAIYTGNHLIVLVGMPIIYNCVDTVSTFKICMVSCHALYLYSFIAVLFTEPRPYWVYLDIKGINCRNGYGIPSEEVLFAMIFFIYTVVEILDKKYKVTRYAMFGFISAWICLLGFTEMYLGSNFPHQIGISLCLGYCYLTVVLSLDTYISTLSLTSSYYTTKNRTVKVYWFISCMALLLILATLDANVPTNSNTSIVWIKKAYTNCNFPQDVSGSYSYNQSSWVFYNTGAVFGGMLASKKLPHGWWKSPWWKRIIRSILSSGISIAIWFGFNAIETYDKTSEYTFNYALPAILCSYISFGILPLFFEEFNLNGQFNRESPGSPSGVSIFAFP